MCKSRFVMKILEDRCKLITKIIQIIFKKGYLNMILMHELGDRYHSVDTYKLSGDIHSVDKELLLKHPLLEINSEEYLFAFTRCTLVSALFLHIERNLYLDDKFSYKLVRSEDFLHTFIKVQCREIDNVEFIIDPTFNQMLFNIKEVNFVKRSFFLGTLEDIMVESKGKEAFLGLYNCYSKATDLGVGEGRASRMLQFLGDLKEHIGRVGEVPDYDLFKDLYTSYNSMQDLILQESLGAPLL